MAHLVRFALLMFAGLLSAGVALGAEKSMQDPLLDHLVGKWRMQGTVMGQDAVHDVEADWVMEHQYLRLHEVSREKTKDGLPVYEAMVFIDWVHKSHRYECVWLDNHGGEYPAIVGHGKRRGDDLLFVFDYPESPFHTTFSYSAKDDIWNWTMDAEDKGKLQPFARLKLTRAN